MIVIDINGLRAVCNGVIRTTVITNWNRRLLGVNFVVCVYKEHLNVVNIRDFKGTRVFTQEVKEVLGVNVCVDRLSSSWYTQILFKYFVVEFKGEVESFLGDLMGVIFYKISTREESYGQMETVALLQEGDKLVRKDFTKLVRELGVSSKWDVHQLVTYHINMFGTSNYIYSDVSNYRLDEGLIEGMKRTSWEVKSSIAISLHT